jgi:hypothetical protein
LSQEAGPQSKLAGLLSLLPKQIKAGAIVVVRTEGDVSLLERYDELVMVERRQWGTMAITMFTLEQMKNEQ